MRYKESKEQSAELLRRVLALMGQHDAAFNPMSFTVWYEFAAGINARLTHAIEVAVRAQSRLNDETISDLYYAFVSDVDSTGMQRISGEFQRMMEGMAESALRTGGQASVFGTKLQGFSAALSTQDATQMSSRVTQVLVDTAQMQSSANALERELQTSRQELGRLQGDLVRARDEAILDPLTRVLNRKGFDQQLTLMLAEPAATGSAHGLIMLDIDHFKNVNDTHGHVMGDRVIQALGEVLRSCVTDKTHSTARYGGEEFSILMPHGSLDAGMALAEAIRLKTRAMKIRDRRTQEVVLTVTVSAGVAVLHPGDDAQALVERADAALYQSKQAGRDRVTGA